MAKKIAGNPVVALSDEGGLATVVHQSAAHAIEYLRNAKLGGTAIPDLAARLGVTPEILLQSLRLTNDTMGKRITENGDLSPAERDRIYRVERVLSRASRP
ncbi:MAG: hypothetical protein M3R60_18315 [Pseudomonadota bacterium]|nr:hypothetical protein [Pseudomonadota bacterium]